MKTEKKLTAMQEFIDRLKNDFGFVVSNNVAEMYLEKEKQQIIDAYWDGGQDIPLTEIKYEQYFEQTFKK